MSPPSIRPHSPCPHNVRHRYNCLLHQQAEGVRSAPPVRRSSQPLELMYQQSNHLVGSLPSQEAKCPCIFPQQTFHSRPQAGVPRFSLHNIFTLWGTPTRDLFASQANRKCTMYCSRGALRGHSQGDALLLPWSDQFNCAFPPLPLLPGVLHKIQQDKA